MMSPESVHKLVGAVLLAFAVLALLEQSGRLRGTWPKYVLPGGLLVLGLLLLLDPIVFHGGSLGAEGVQHQLQGAGLILVGVAETARSRGRLRGRPFAALLPLTIIATGVLFLLHSQHQGGDAILQVVQHRLLGITIILAGLVKGADSLGLARGNWAAVGWLLLVLCVVAELFLYTEMGVPVPHGGH